jgi:hypothetical protein
MKHGKFLLVMTVLVCLAFQACAAMESPINKSSNNTSSNNTSSIGTSPISPINITPINLSSTNTMGSSESDKTKVSGGTNITMGSSGDYLNPNIISSEYYPNFPWYSSDVSFFSQGYNETTFSFFSEYYITSGMPVVGIVSNPAKFDITQKMPSRIYFGTGQALPYDQYVSTVASRNNELWIQGENDWSQYVVSPTGTWLQMVAYAPVGGPAGFYEIVQTNTNTLDYRTYQFYPGYNTMYFNADQVGRHMLYFVVNNQPSNVVIVDVFAQAEPGSMPPSSM